MRLQIGPYSATVHAIPEQRAFRGVVKVRGRGWFTFVGRSYRELERECAKSARILAREKYAGYTLRVAGRTLLQKRLRAALHATTERPART